ncbi:hypothetical protein L6452_36632 [Arctium lappa]|uniref:Uncharacterized protein n=1 Tax=Arctium lappa TaxID=4217 RepID=A0ACB8YA74_ARCLA|nr:hypothetical protein L6452_36632 [Arctium lappa]
MKYFMFGSFSETLIASNFYDVAEIEMQGGGREAERDVACFFRSYSESFVGYGGRGAVGRLGDANRHARCRYIEERKRGPCPLEAAGSAHG